MGVLIDMTKDKSHKKTAIFIDGSNIYIGGRDLFGIRVRPENLISILSEDKFITQVYYFSSEDPNNRGQQRFHDSLRNKGIVVVTEPIVEREQKITCPNCRIEVKPICENCGEIVTLPPHKSKKIDILLGAKLLDLCDTYDDAIIASGDQDFIPIINILREQKGKKIYIASFEKPLSHEYRLCTDGITILDDYIEQLK